MCNEAVEVDPWQLKDVTDHFKTQKMCDDGVWGQPFPLQFVSDWFVTQQQLKILHDYDDDYDDDKLIDWYEGYQNGRLKKQRLRRSYCTLHGILIV